MYVCSEERKASGKQTRRCMNVLERASMSAPRARCYVARTCALAHKQLARERARTHTQESATHWLHCVHLLHCVPTHILAYRQEHCRHESVLRPRNARACGSVRCASVQRWHCACARRRRAKECAKKSLTTKSTRRPQPAGRAAGPPGRPVRRPSCRDLLSRVLLSVAPPPWPASASASRARPRARDALALRAPAAPTPPSAASAIWQSSQPPA